METTYTIVIQCWQPSRIVAYVMLDDVPAAGVVDAITWTIDGREFANATIKVDKNGGRELHSVNFRVDAGTPIDDVLTHVRTFLESDDDGKE